MIISIILIEKTLNIYSVVVNNQVIVSKLFHIFPIQVNASSANTSANDIYKHVQILSIFIHRML